MEPKREDFKEAIEDALAKIQHLVNYMDARGMLEEGCFTFPDGETWESQRRQDLKGGRDGEPQS